MAHSDQRLAVLGLGANLGPAEDTLRWAIRSLAPFVTDLRVAPLYRSPAASPIPQPDYLNTVVTCQTRLPTDALLAVGKRLEWLAGRRPGPRLGPRPLDVDLLLYEGVSLDLPELTVPHSRLLERRFVLEPLADLLPELTIPDTGRTYREALGALKDPSSLTRLSWRRHPQC